MLTEHSPSDPRNGFGFGGSNEPLALNTGRGFLPLSPVPAEHTGAVPAHCQRTGQAYGLFILNTAQAPGGDARAGQALRALPVGKAQPQEQGQPQAALEAQARLLAVISHREHRCSAEVEEEKSCSLVLYPLPPTLAASPPSTEFFSAKSHHIHREFVNIFLQ